jgi:hypothetical protein
MTTDKARLQELQDLAQRLEGAYRDSPAREDLPFLEHLDESTKTGCCAVCGQTDPVAISLEAGPGILFCLCQDCLPLTLVDDAYGALRLLAYYGYANDCLDIPTPGVHLVLSGADFLPSSVTWTLEANFWEELPEGLDCHTCGTCGRVLLVVAEGGKHKRRVSRLRRNLWACCNGHGRGPGNYPANLQRAAQRLADRADRKCEHCGKVFTPKNSLGKTCSTRCRVARHRQQREEAAQARRGRRRGQETKTEGKRKSVSVTDHDLLAKALPLIVESIAVMQEPEVRRQDTLALDHVGWVRKWLRDVPAARKARPVLDATIRLLKQTSTRQRTALILEHLAEVEQILRGALARIDGADDAPTF